MTNMKLWLHNRSRLILFAAICLWSISASAEVRTAEQAADVARSFQTPSSSAGVRLAPPMVRLMHTIVQPTSEPAAYVFGYEANGGYVIVSADDRARTILGYTDSGTWHSDSIPDNMRVWLEHYAEEIAVLQGHSLPSVADDQFALSNNGHPSALHPSITGITVSDVMKTVPDPARQPAQKKQAVTPLLGNIMWNQSVPYNNNCPIDPDNSNARCYTGCTATGAAQIMRKWEHPKTGTGSHSYYWAYGQQTLTASFAHAYEWENMLGQYGGYNSYTPVQASAVALLMSDLGIAADMSYGGVTAGGSGAYTEKMAVAMQNYFDYDKSMLCLSPTYMGQATFESYVAQEIQNGRPLLLRGSTATGGGHAFVCDGLDDAGYYHINWGWGGSLNGHFALSALDPTKSGSEGSTSKAGYSVDVKAVMNIFPNQDGSVSPPQIGTKQILTTKKNLQTGDEFTIVIRQIANYGLYDWQGNVTMAIVDNEKKVVAQIGDMYSDFSIKILSYSSENYSFTGTLPSLSDGTYYVVPLYSVGENWYNVTVPGDLPLIVESNGAYFDVEEAEPSFLYYTSTDGETVNAQQAFNVPIISNTYIDGQGEIMFDGTVTEIGNYAFYQCANLQTITIPSTVTTIGNYACYECTGLESITIPTTVTSVGWYAFYGCSSLPAITVDANNPNYSSADGVFFNKNKNTLIQYPVGKAGTSYTIPSSVSTIYYYAFANCENLESVTIPTSVTTIRTGAFSDCSALTSISIPRDVSIIGDYAFFGCSQLQSIDVHSSNTHYSSQDGVLLNKPQTQLIQYPIGHSRIEYTIPNSVENIAGYAFCYASHLESVTIPGSVTVIGDGGLAACENLASLTCLAATPPTLGKDVFEETPTDIRLYVPLASLSAYQAAEQWNALRVKYDQVTQQVLLLDQDADNAEEIAYAASNYADPICVTIHRGTFKGGMYNTVCFPFAMTAAQIETAFGAGCDVQALTSSAIQGEDLHIRFTAVSEMEAGKPYLIMPAEDITVSSVEDVTISVDEPVDVPTTNATFKGLFSPSAPFAAKDKTILFVTAGNTLNYPSATGSIAGMRAYLVLTETAAKAAQRMVLHANDRNTPSGIMDEVTNAIINKMIDNNQVILIINGQKYDLQGRRL